MEQDIFWEVGKSTGQEIPRIHAAKICFFFKFTVHIQYEISSGRQQR
jgi:hypothetical protein